MNMLSSTVATAQTSLWSEQDRLDDDHTRRRDASRLSESTGHSSSNPFAVRGRCSSCPRKLYGAEEVNAGVCTDCRIAAGHTVCAGCDDFLATRRYLVTFHNGTSEHVRYCDDCASLARMDCNGETASIAEAA